MAASPSGDIDGTGVKLASSSWIQPRFALGPDVVRWLTAPATIWMTPAPPAVRESLPESVNFSPAPPAAGFEMMILPVVHGEYRSANGPQRGQAHLENGNVQAGDHDAGRHHGGRRRASHTKNPCSLRKDHPGDTSRVSATERRVRTRRSPRTDLCVDRDRRSGVKTRPCRRRGEGELSRPAKPRPERIRVGHGPTKAGDRDGAHGARRKHCRSGRPGASRPRRESGSKTLDPPLFGRPTSRAHRRGPSACAEIPALLPHSR